MEKKTTQQQQNKNTKTWNQFCVGQLLLDMGLDLDYI